jgi:signal transduction histidine kinase
MIACSALSTMADRAPSHHAARRAAIGALAAELGHELQGPVNLFRLASERLGRGEALDEEDVSLLGEELDRLSSLSARLRELARTPLRKVECTPRQVLEVALSARLGSPLASRPSPLELDLEAAEGLTLSCDPELLGRALGELVDNALEAKAARAGVRFGTGDAAGFCVWDDGPGFELGSERSLHWGVTTRPSAAGLGLTLALRAARAHGFRLELRRMVSFTEAWLLLPSRELETDGLR